MADNDNYEDEYQFADPDAPNADFSDDSSSPGDGVKSVSDQSRADQSFLSKNRVLRNVLIVVALIIIVMIVYPFMRSSSSDITPVPSISHVKNTIAPGTPQPVSVSPGLNDQITQKLSAMEANQEQMQTAALASSSQLSGMSNTMNDMMTKITELNNTIALYATKVDEQSRVIEQLVVQASALKHAQTKRHIVSRKRIAPSLQYYIQAVIPGRAWLIASNGSTLTVREGTLIQGLGKVTLIDPRQGRVLTSSGKVVRFSQEDS